MSILKRWLGKLTPDLTRPQIPEGKRYYVFGDVHGRADLLKRLMAAVDDDLKERPVEKVTEIFLGDYIDRGPASYEVLDILSAPPPAGRERICLMGNHESVMLTFLSDPDILPRWANVGGDQTLASYGITLPPTAENAEKIQNQLRSALPARHLQFLRTLKLIHRAHGYAFVHAGVRPGVPLHEQSDQDLMWIRHEFLDYTGNFGAVVVHGHTPQDNVEVKANRINLDTGAYLSGKLTCASLSTEQQGFIQTNFKGDISINNITPQR